ncbi:hypothetical protein [Cupriavidus necator]|uniref:hypothetical protein n=1 Tax=Cupriavidus necator TaxID=106590 RepID=UPI00339D32A9
MGRSFKKKTKRTANYMRNTKSPRSYRPLFRRVSMARNLAQIHAALADLVPRLLGRGQAPEVVTHDLSQLAHKSLADAVLPVVHERAIALRGRAA